MTQPVLTGAPAKMSTGSSGEPVVQARKLTKSFGSTIALSGVDFELSPGEIHALVGENGAGKSTLIRILAGDYQADAGELLINGDRVSFSSPSDAVRKGIGFVHQVPAFVPDLSITENLFLGHDYPKKYGLIDWRSAHDETRRAVGDLGLSIDAEAMLASLSTHQRQIVAIGRALRRKPRILVLDEVTASLSDPEVNALLEQIRGLRESGTSIIYVSHRLEEIFRVADRCTVFRDGKRVTTLPVEGLSQSEVAAHIVGQAVPDLFERKTDNVPAPSGDNALVVSGLADECLHNVSFSVTKGEILGIAGLGGSGRTRLLRLLYGALPRTQGTVRLDGKLIAPSSVNEALANGIAMVSEDRNVDGYVQSLTVGQNTTLPWLREFRRLGLVSLTRENRDAKRRIDRLNIKTPSPHADMSQLSGGNQQKALFSRWTDNAVQVLLLDEPTHGVDIGSKAQIYEIIRNMRARGVAIILVSSELEELVALCDRALIMNRGSIQAEMPGKDLSKDRLLHRLLEDDRQEGLLH